MDVTVRQCASDRPGRLLFVCPPPGGAGKEAMNRNRVARRLSRRPARVCEHVDQAWGPHEGCREFMSEPDEIPCGEPATRLLTAYVNDGRRSRPVAERLCTEHAVLHAQTDAATPYVEAVLVRPLAGAR